MAAVLSAGTADAGEQLRVGRTGIFCVTQPCPWRGIAAADGQRLSPADLLWSQPDLPLLDATAEDARRIREAWDNDACLLIDGRLMDGRLKVERIAGECT